MKRRIHLCKQHCLVTNISSKAWGYAVAPINFALILLLHYKVYMLRIHNKSPFRKCILCKVFTVLLSTPLFDAQPADYP